MASPNKKVTVVKGASIAEHFNRTATELTNNKNLTVIQKQVKNIRYIKNMIKQGHLPNTFVMDNDRLMEPIEEFISFD